MSSLGIQYWTVLVSKILAPGVVTAPQWVFTGGNVASMELGEDFSKIGLSPICIRSYKIDSILWPDSSESKTYHNLPVNKNPINCQIAMILPWISLKNPLVMCQVKLWLILPHRGEEDLESNVDLFLETAGTLLAIMHLDDSTTGWFTEGSIPPQQSGEKKWYTHPSVFPVFGHYC